MPARKLCSLSVDLDPVSCYYRIHALGPAPAAIAEVILKRALPRFVEMFGRHGIRATFFVVGSDLESSSARRQLKDLAAAGHELANHSFSHPYDLARLERERVRDEIRRCHDAIGEAAGVSPEGFRAPRYDVSAAMLDEMATLGYRYDSSIFPAPAYYAAKAVIMGMLRLTGRKSGAVLTDPRALLAPPDPYRPDMRAPWRRGQAPLVELPIAVTPGLRVPAIGTSLLTVPTALRARWLEDMRARPFFNLEMHGIDLIDAEIDGIPAELGLRQPDLRQTLETKRRALEATLGRLALEYDFVPLKEVALRVQREGKA
jgi:peptidoglycan-N-acetylglucosamine deacetylase